MSPLPWPLIGRITPHPAPAPAPAGNPNRNGTRYLRPGERPAPGDPLWLAAESAALARIAEAGGDLDAHRREHLKEAR